jgi:phosphoheptose isomerase
METCSAPECDLNAVTQLRRIGRYMGVLDQDSVAAHLRKACETLKRAAEDPDFRNAIVGIAETITHALRDGGKILFAGNCDSAGDAQHIAGEFLSRLNFDRNPLPPIALTTDTSVLTPIGNDYGYDKVFERQVRGVGRPGDVFIAISTSGRSVNVIAAGASMPMPPNRHASATTTSLSRRISSTARQNCGWKLMFLGAACVYPRLAPQPMSEDSLLDGQPEPTNESYTIAKIAGIKLCQAYRRQHGCDFISVVPGESLRSRRSVRSGGRTCGARPAAANSRSQDHWRTGADDLGHRSSAAGVHACR